VDSKFRKVGDNLVARRILVCFKEFLIVVVNLLRDVQLQLWKEFPVGGDDVVVNNSSHMEYYIIVCRVVVVSVYIPVVGTIMNLHVSHPQCTVNLHLSVEEVWSRIAVVQTRVNHLHQLAVGGVHFL